MQKIKIQTLAFFMQVDCLVFSVFNACLWQLIVFQTFFSFEVTNLDLWTLADKFLHQSVKDANHIQHIPWAGFFVACVFTYCPSLKRVTPKILTFYIAHELMINKYLYFYLPLPLFTFIYLYLPLTLFIFIFLHLPLVAFPDVLLYLKVYKFSSVLKRQCSKIVVNEMTPLLNNFVEETKLKRPVYTQVTVPAKKSLQQK